jgi:hypothetical protein
MGHLSAREQCKGSMSRSKRMYQSQDGLWQKRSYDKLRVGFTAVTISGGTQSCFVCPHRTGLLYWRLGSRLSIGVSFAWIGNGCDIRCDILSDFSISSFPAREAAHCIGSRPGSKRADAMSQLRIKIWSLAKKSRQMGKRFRYWQT